LIEAFDELAPSFLAHHPCNKNQLLLRLKFYGLMHVISKWLERYKMSLYLVTEQAFETYHNHQEAFLENASINKTGFISA
jgi:hypothetical protein